MRFTITHPMHSHPYNPELVTGSGIATVAAAAEAAGFHGFGFTDHPAPSQRWLESGGHDALDPFVAMGFAAARTTTLRLIPNIVVLPYRNPFVVAKSGATLDMLSDGRFTLAVGVGYLKREFAALGVDFDERAAAVRGGVGGDPRPSGPPTTSRSRAGISPPRASPPIRGRSAGRIRRSGSAATRPPPGSGWPRTATAGARFPAPAVLAQTARTAAMDSVRASPKASPICGADATPRAGTGRASTSPSPISAAAVPAMTTSTPTPTCPGWKSLRRWG